MENSLAEHLRGMPKKCELFKWGNFHMVIELDQRGGASSCFLEASVPSVRTSRTLPRPKSPRSSILQSFPQWSAMCSEGQCLNNSFWWSDGRFCTRTGLRLCFSWYYGLDLVWSGTAGWSSGPVTPRLCLGQDSNWVTSYFNFTWHLQGGPQRLTILISICHNKIRK